MSIDTPPPEAPDYDEVADALYGVGAPQGAADAHGLLCALLCAEPSLDVAGWLDRLGANAMRDDDTLRTLLARTRAQLSGERFDLAPWLPGDATPLMIRARALGEWCQGFLGGLGLAGVDPARLGGEASEFVADLATIAQATYDADADTEGAERDFAELVEFLRIGTYLVRDALQPATPHRKPS
jgi:uncharacterized protein YgfB (UPF0149 family)